MSAGKAWHVFFCISKALFAYASPDLKKKILFEKPFLCENHLKVRFRWLNKSTFKKLKLSSLILL